MAQRTRNWCFLKSVSILINFLELHCVFSGNVSKFITIFCGMSSYMPGFSMHHLRIFFQTRAKTPSYQLGRLCQILPSLVVHSRRLASKTRLKI